MAVVPFTGPRQARPPEADVDPSFLQMAGAMIYNESKIPTWESSGNTEEDYNNSWMGSESRKGRNDLQMRSLYPDLEPFSSKDSDLIHYHKKKDEENEGAPTS
jgi:hypothetical protein